MVIVESPPAFLPRIVASTLKVEKGLKEMDVILSDLLFNVFGKRYKVKYIDNSSVETKRKV